MTKRKYTEIMDMDDMKALYQTAMRARDGDELCQDILTRDMTPELVALMSSALMTALEGFSKAASDVLQIQKTCTCGAAQKV